MFFLVLKLRKSPFLLSLLFRKANSLYYVKKKIRFSHSFDQNRCPPVLLTVSSRVSSLIFGLLTLNKHSLCTVLLHPVTSIRILNDQSTTHPNQDHCWKTSKHTRSIKDSDSVSLKKTLLLRRSLLIFPTWVLYNTGSDTYLRASSHDKTIQRKCSFN